MPLKEKIDDVIELDGKNPRWWEKISIFSDFIDKHKKGGHKRVFSTLFVTLLSFLPSFLCYIRFLLLYTHAGRYALRELSIYTWNRSTSQKKLSSFYLRWISHGIKGENFLYEAFKNKKISPGDFSWLLTYFCEINLCHKQFIGFVDNVRHGDGKVIEGGMKTFYNFFEFYCVNYLFYFFNENIKIKKFKCDKGNLLI